MSGEVWWGLKLSVSVLYNALMKYSYDIYFLIVKLSLLTNGTYLVEIITVAELSHLVTYTLARVITLASIWPEAGKSEWRTGSCKEDKWKKCNETSQKHTGEQEIQT